MAAITTLNSVKQLNCFQINLQHSKAATANINQLVDLHNIDLLFVQEPYNVNNQVAGISKQYRIFSSGDRKKRAAIIILNKHLDAILLNQLSDEDAVAIEVIHGNFSFYAISMYMDIKEDINTDLMKIDNFISFTKGAGMVLAIDSNARSSMWYDILTNTRGKRMEEYLSANNLFVINEDSAHTTFETIRGRSNIDLTVTNSCLLSQLYQWECSEEESCSDHRIISFKIGKNTFSKQQPAAFKGMKYILKEDKFNDFRDIVARELTNEFLNGGSSLDLSDLDKELYRLVTLEADMEIVIGKHQKILNTACRETCKIKSATQKKNGRKSVPWWTDQLTIMRKRTNAHRRRFQKTKANEELREQRKKQYMEEKRKYEATIRKEKIQSWKNFCSLTPSNNPWKTAYRLVSGNKKNSALLTTMKKPDGSITYSVKDTLEYMLDTFVPTDEINEDSDHHRDIRDNAMTPIQTHDDKEFTQEEIKTILEQSKMNKSPGEDGITNEILLLVFRLFPRYMTAIYNGCLKAQFFPKQWKRAMIQPIVKPGKENANDISKFRPISLLNTGAKLLEKLLINRIMHHVFTNDLLNRKQFGFTPQTSTVDALMTVKKFVEDGIANGQYVVLVSLDVKGAFDAAWWPSVLYAMQIMNCPRNLYNLMKSYLSERTAVLCTNNVKVEKKVTKGCPQGSCCGPGLWNILYNSLLNKNYSQNTNVIAFADDFLMITKGKSALEAENYANVEIQKIENWARSNKMRFNEDKSKVILISKKRKQDKSKISIYLNNKELEQVDSFKYLGIIFDNKFKFNRHVEYISDKCTQLINILGRSAKLNWGLRHEALKTIYKGAVLPLLSYAVPVWINALERQANCNKINRVQRLINIKMAKAFRTTSNEALCIINGLTPIVIKLKEIAKVFQIRQDLNNSVDLPINYRNWPHPADAVEISETNSNKQYDIEIYTDGSKSEEGVGSGIAMYINNSLAHQLRYKLDRRCSNNQAEQLAIMKALEKVQQLKDVGHNLRKAAVYTDSRISIDSLKNSNNHNTLIEQIRAKLRLLKNKDCRVDISWVKAHAGNLGNEKADLLAKEAARSSQEVVYRKVPRSEAIRILREESKEIWQREWQTTSKGAETKTFFPTVTQRLATKLSPSHNLTAMLTGHGKLKSYFYRFKIIQDPSCSCNGEEQHVNHLILDCSKLNAQRRILKEAIYKKGRTWPCNRTDLIGVHKREFQKFVKEIDFEDLQN